LGNIPNGHKIFQHLPSKGPPKFTQIGIFGFENKPSGDPVPGIGLRWLFQLVEWNWSSQVIARKKLIISGEP
jgi:hypothetical protein